jgi:hypothetical protein
MKLNRAMMAKLNGVTAELKGLWRHFSFVELMFGSFYS